MEFIKRNLAYLLIAIFSMLAAVLFSAPGYLGVEFEEITAEYAQENSLPVTYGVLITNVLPGTGAEKADIKVGDIILEIDNQKIEDGSLFSELIADKDTNEKINLKVMRDGKTFEVEAVLSTSPMEKKFITVIPHSPIFRTQDKSSISISGMYLHKLNSDLSEYFGVKDGYLVVSVIKDSNAGKAGFKPGDVLQSIDNQPILSNSDFEKVYKTTDDGKEFKFKIVRKNKELTLQMKSDHAEIATLEWFANPLSYKIIAEEDARSRVYELEQRAKKEAREIEKEMQKIEEKTKYLGTEEAKKIREEALANLKERQKEIEVELKERQKEIEADMKSRLIELKVKDIDQLNQKLESDVLKKLEQKIKDLESRMKELEKKLQEKETRNK